MGAWTGVAAATDYYATTQAGFDYLNTVDFEPGDRILLAGGTTFSGRLTLGTSDTGTDPEGNLVAPIIVTSFGSGRATISAGDGSAITSHNSGGIEISRLNLVGSGVAADGTTTSTRSGISFYVDSPGDLKYRHVRIDDVEVSGFGRRGIAIGGYNGDSGYHDVRLTRVVAHDNLHSGIETYGYPGSTQALTQVVVADCVAHHHPGDPNSTINTGNGIVLGGVTGAVIERCEAHNNGINNHPSAGPVGIWTYSSSGVVIQHNESHHNLTSGGDGGGFDLDIRVSGSVMQYNYSHDNAGSGFLVYGMAGSSSNVGNVVRYNISENDGRDPGSPAASGINISNNVRNVAVYGNTVLMSAPPGSTSIPAIKVVAADVDPDEILVANNIFVTTGDTRLVQIYSSGDVTFAGNNYWSSSGDFVIRDGSTSYGSLTSWRNDTGQERLGGQATGMSVDPIFQTPPIPITLPGSPTLGHLVAFKLQPTSPLLGRGLDLKTKFGVDPGPRDFFGVKTWQGVAYEIGAHEFALDPPTILGIEVNPAGPTVTIRYQSEIGSSFAVRRSANLSGDPTTEWTLLTPTAGGDGSIKEYLDTPPAGASHFYVLVRE